MKAYIIITAYDARFKHTENTIFFTTDKENIDELADAAIDEMYGKGSIFYVAQEEGEYSSLNEFLIDVYGYEITELRVVSTIDGVDFYA